MHRISIKFSTAAVVMGLLVTSVTLADQKFRISNAGARNLCLTIRDVLGQEGMKKCISDLASCDGIDDDKAKTIIADCRASNSVDISRCIARLCRAMR